MGSVEIADCMEGRAGYVIASPELEPQDGYDYSWMTALGDNLPSDMGMGEKQWAGLWWRPMMPTMPQVLRCCHEPFWDMKEYPAFHEVFHQYVDGIPQELREELYRGAGKGQNENAGIWQ